MWCCVFFVYNADAITLGAVGGRPAQVQGQEQRHWFVYNTHIGESFTDQIELMNNTDEAVTVRLYPADSAKSSDGTFAVKQRNEARAYVGAWIALSQSEIVLPPRSTQVVDFTVSIPADQHIDGGEYTGGIMIENIDDDPVRTGGVSVSIRAGVRVYITIPGSITHAMHLEYFRVTELFGAFRVLDEVVAIHNDGNVVQNVSLVTTADMSSFWQRWFAFQLLPANHETKLQVLPGQTLVRHFTFDKPWIGIFTAQAYVVYQDADGVRTLISEPVSIVCIPPLYILIPVVLFILFVYFSTYRVYKKRNHSAKV